VKSAARETIHDFAEVYAHRLRDSILPYFARISFDECGGYLVWYDVKRSGARRRAHAVRRRFRPDRRRRDIKRLVAQARLVWVFSYAHRNGIGEYLGTAQRGYRFLVDHFLDRDEGGYVWATDRTGVPVDRTKMLYGQAFVIYAFVEYARASGEREPLEHALALHGVVNERLRDRDHRGWREHGGADWSDLGSGTHPAAAGAVGRKSADTHLHWMEALTALSRATGDDGARRSLRDAYDIMTARFFTRNTAEFAAYCAPDWSTDRSSPHPAPYGLAAEWAWLALEAERALGRQESWQRSIDVIDDVLDRGFDHQRGGVYATAAARSGVRSSDKIWWAQAEMVTALTELIVRQPDPRYEQALAQILTFVERHQVDAVDGVWLHTVTARGHRRVPVKSGPWKVGYHEVRALTRLTRAFAPEHP
jgi:cellobiose epimerase